MNASLKNDVDRLFSVFLNNTLDDLHKLLPPVPEAQRYQRELERELDEFHAAILNRLEKESTL